MTKIMFPLSGLKVGLSSTGHSTTKGGTEERTSTFYKYKRVNNKDIYYILNRFYDKNKVSIYFLLYFINCQRQRYALHKPIFPTCLLHINK